MLQLAADELTHIGPLPITNALVNTVLVDALIIALAWYIYKNAAVIPTRFQTVFELVVDGFYGLTKQVSKDNAHKIFPFVMTFFLFILLANWTGLLPIITAITVETHGHETHLIRSASTDLNTTLALAFVSLISTHTMSIQTLGIKSYISRFLSFNPLALYTGILEIVSEITKIISFSFRLFGNIFVGEVMLVSLSAYLAFLAPIPLIMYEIFVGMIQAAIFGLLTMAFMGIFTTPHGEH